MKRFLAAVVSLVLALALVVMYGHGDLAYAGSASGGVTDSGDDDSGDDDSGDDDSDDDDSDDDDSDDDDSDDDDSDDDDSDDDDSDDDDSDDDDSDDDDDDDDAMTPEQLLARKLAKAEAKAAELRAEAEQLLASASAKAAAEQDPIKAQALLAEAQAQADELLSKAASILAEAPAKAMEEAIEHGLLGAVDPAVNQAIHHLYDEVATKFVTAHQAGKGFTISPEGQTVITPDQIFTAFQVSLRVNMVTGNVRLVKEGVEILFTADGTVTVDGHLLTPEMLAALQNTTDPALQSFGLLLQARPVLDFQGNPTLVIDRPSSATSTTP